MDTSQSQMLNINAFIEEGVALLRRNMANYPSFDPNKPYDEKNAYFVELALRGEEQLFRQGLHWVAEIYFQRLLAEILEYEQANNKHFNKGMAYANLGIAQMAIGKFDLGIAHLLAADWEDRDFPQPDNHGILNTRLWQQFEHPIIFDYLIGFNGNPNAALHFDTDEAFLNNFFSGMDKQDRLFLEGTIWALRESLRQNNERANAYTQGRLYSGLKDLCLLTETLLRKKQIAGGRIAAGTRIMLGNLFNNVLTGLGIGYPQNTLSTSANNLQELLDNLENTLYNTTVSPEIRRIYCLHLVRNFTGHHFDPSETVTSAGGRTFFDMYETTLVNILSAILYFKHINAI